MGYRRGRRIVLDRPGLSDAQVADAVTNAAHAAHDREVITELAVREGVVALVVPPSTDPAAGHPAEGGRQFGPVEALARSVLQLADLGGMPDTYWQSDSRVTLARAQLGVPRDGRHSHKHLWDVGGT